MNIDPDIVDLINAEIDGELSVDDRERLDIYLAGSPAAREYRDDLAAFCGQLNTIDKLEPPEHLQNLILDNLKPTATKESSRGLFDVLAVLFGVNGVRYAASFAAGVILTYALVNSGQISDGAFDDVTNLVGTMTQPEPLGEVARVDDLRLTLSEIAGTVTLNRSGPMLIIDFDLASESPVEIIAGFNDPDVWFNGFAQLESEGTSISAATGQVTLRTLGQGRYAVYLYDASPGEATVNLRFISSGALIHEETLEFREENQPD